MPATVQDFIYPLSATSRFVFDGHDAVNPQNFWPSAVKGQTDEWRIATAFRLVEPGDRVWAYFGGKVRFIAGVGAVSAPVAWNDQWGEYTIHITWDAELTAALRDSPIPYEDYGQHVQAAMSRANPKTKRVLDRWLRGHQSGVEASPQLAFVRHEVAARLGQPQFRSAALRAYRGACAISACEEQSTLQAAHIVPVSKKGQHAIANSMILRADLHNLFDLGLIWVDSKFAVQVSDEVKDSGYRKLRGTPVAIPDGAKKSDMKPAFAAHRALHSR